MHEYPLPPEPKSPGEYINIDFSETGARLSPPAPPLLASAASSSSLLSASSPASSLGSVTQTEYPERGPGGVLGCSPVS
ncbi:Insulin receptor substrate 2 [Pteropus alecto]|uniref:Insulin receptor substrate 2 n=1 Tax=Pteropus alecto TaxID=9402 RepID=L5KU21_PTEAL|nr:Insulin receptor substrate 2 [Pteropus alecto]